MSNFKPNRFFVVIKKNKDLKFISTFSRNYIIFINILELFNLFLNLWKVQLFWSFFGSRLKNETPNKLFPLTVKNYIKTIVTILYNCL